MSSIVNNPWHSVSYGDINGEEVTSIIEISKNSRSKYELDKETGLLSLDRIIYSPFFYPANYGFIPQTYCDDGDPLDVLVLSSVEILPMTLVKVKIIGVMKMVDQGEGDDKLIAVFTGDKSVNHINDISELPEHTLNEMKHFFEEYKTLEKKEVKINGFADAVTAKEIFKQSIKDYQEQILPTLK